MMTVSHVQNMGCVFLGANQNWSDSQHHRWSDSQHLSSPGLLPSNRGAFLGSPVRPVLSGPISASPVEKQTSSSGQKPIDVKPADARNIGGHFGSCLLKHEPFRRLRVDSSDPHLGAAAALTGHPARLPGGSLPALSVMPQVASCLLSTGRSSIPTVGQSSIRPGVGLKHGLATRAVLLRFRTEGRPVSRLRQTHAPGNTGAAISASENAPSPVNGLRGLSPNDSTRPDFRSGVSPALAAPLESRMPTRPPPAPATDLCRSRPIPRESRGGTL